MKTENNNWIFLRGLTRGKGHWVDFIERFQKANPQAVIELLDIPGNGSENKKTSPLHIQDYVYFIRSNSKFVKEKKKFNLVGHSLGGMVTVHWAHLFPEDLHKIFVMNSSLRGTQPAFERFKIKNIKWLVLYAFEKDFIKKEGYSLKVISNNATRSLEVVKSLAEYTKKYPVKDTNFFRQMIAGARAEMPISLDVPTKIIASKEDQLASYKNSVVIAEKLHGELVLHETAGHDIAIDDPEWLIRQLCS